MNRDSFEHQIDWDELDRLVDGQLGSFEYRQLLQRIEEHPEGWRRCALAFLEHQAFGCELTDLAEGSKSLYAVAEQEKVPSEELDSQPSEEKVSLARPTTRTSGRLSGLITMTACILVGLAVGNSFLSEFQEQLPPRGIDGKSSYPYDTVTRSKTVGAPGLRASESPFCNFRNDIYGTDIRGVE